LKLDQPGDTGRIKEWLGFKWPTVHEVKLASCKIRDGIEMKLLSFGVKGPEWRLSSEIRAGRCLKAS